jgi:endonuclease I
MHMKKNFTLFLLFISFLTFAQAPTGYYNTAEGKNTSNLRTALQTIITNGATDVGYAGLWTAYAKTDETSDGKIWDMYSNCTFAYQTKQCGTYSVECDCYNREHTSPQSWFSSATPMVSDLFNVYPTDGKVNGMRNNYPYGEVGTATYTSGNGSKLGTSSFSGYTGTVFEPVNEYKGDFARTYFYMATRYAGLCESWTSGADVVYSSANLGLTTYAMNLFLKWSREDPVSAKEINRNNAVYGVQNNRNPFIDNPGLEEYIWGNKTSEAFSASGTVTTPYLSTPSNGVSLQFSSVVYQQTGTATISIKGANLTGDLSLALSGTNAGYFSLPTTTISSAQAQNGYTLTVSYVPQAVGTHTATLTISGGGITPTTVTLNATGKDTFSALAAGNITSTGFTANWNASVGATGYALNVFSMSGSTGDAPKTLLEEDFATSLPTTWTSDLTGYSDVSLASNIKLGSSSKFGKITSPAIDLSAPTTLLVRGKQFGSDTGAKLVALVDNDTVAVWTTAVDNQDFTLNLPAKTSSSTISLYAFAKKRVYVDYVKVATQGTTQTAVSVNGYPKSVGNVTNYSVTGLQSDYNYFYTVTPEGSNTGISDQVSVRTASISTGIDKTELNAISWSAVADGILVRNVPLNSTLTVLDMMGRQIQIVENNSSGITLNLTQKGIYLLQIRQNQGIKTYKVRF